MTDQESDSLVELTIEQAELLARSRVGQPIFLNSLRSLPPEVARALHGNAHGKCTTICLNGPRKISADVADELRWCASHGLILDGLETLSEEVAEELSGHDGRWLSLNGVKSMSAAVARYFAMTQLESVSLTGLEQNGVPFEAWEILEEAYGGLDLPEMFSCWDYGDDPEKIEDLA